MLKVLLPVHLSAKVTDFIDFLLERFGPQPYWDRFGGELQSVSREAPNGQIDLIPPRARRSIGLQLKQPQGDLPSLERKGVKHV